jgi:hypothetical protein
VLAEHRQQGVLVNKYAVSVADLHIETGASRQLAGGRNFAIAMIGREVYA